MDHASCDEECGCQRPSSDEFEVESSSEKSDGINGVADPTWPWSSDTWNCWKASLDDNGLDVRSISVKTAFDEDVKHFDRICCHLKVDKAIQMWEICLCKF